MGWLDRLLGITRPPQIETTAPPADTGHRRRSRSDGWVNRLTGIGDPSRDKGAAAVPGSRIPLSDLDLDNAYRFSGLTRRIVDKPAGDATREWLSVNVDDDVGILRDEWKDLDIEAVMQEGLRYARLYGGCPLLLAHDDLDSDGRGMDRPVRQGAALLGIAPLSRIEAKASIYGTNPVRRRTYRRPLWWDISPLGASQVSQRVHHSRVAYIPGNPLPVRYFQARGGYDDSVIESLLDALGPVSQTTAVASTLAQTARTDILRIAGLSKISTTEGQQELLDLRMRAMSQARSLLGLVVIGDGDEFDTRGSTTTGFGELHEAVRLMLSAASGIPQSILFGETPGGLNTDGESGRRQYADLLASIQADALREPVRQIVDTLLDAKGERGLDYQIEWSPTEAPNAIDEAKVRLANAQADSLYLQRGVLTAEHIARSRFRAGGYGDEIKPVTASMLAELEDPGYDDLGGAEGIEPGEPGQEDLAPVPRQDGGTPDRWRVPAGVRANARRIMRWRRDGREVAGLDLATMSLARTVAEDDTASIIEIRAIASLHDLMPDYRAARKRQRDSGAVHPWTEEAIVRVLAAGGPRGVQWARSVLRRHESTRETA